MTISTKGRYALRMLVDLAEHQDRGYIALRDIAVRQGISKKYLEQIIPLLNPRLSGGLPFIWEAGGIYSGADFAHYGGKAGPGGLLKA